MPEAQKLLTLDDLLPPWTVERQMYWLDRIWKGWCQDPKCPNNPFYGVKIGSKIRIKLPDDYEQVSFDTEKNSG